MNYNNTVIMLHSRRTDVTNIVIFDLRKFIKLISKLEKYDSNKIYQALVHSTVNYKANKESLKFLIESLKEHYADTKIKTIELNNIKSSEHNVFFAEQISSNTVVEFEYEMFPEFKIKEKPEDKVIINGDDVIRNMEAITNYPYNPNMEIGISYESFRLDRPRIKYQDQDQEQGR